MKVRNATVTCNCNKTVIIMELPVIEGWLMMVQPWPELCSLQ